MALLTGMDITKAITLMDNKETHQKQFLVTETTYQQMRAQGLITDDNNLASPWDGVKVEVV